MIFDIGKSGDPRHSILMRYRRGEITREEADAEARASGFESMECRPDPREFDPLNEPFWTVPMALAWIIYRSSEPVREVMEDYRTACLVWQHTGYPSIEHRIERPELLSPQKMDIFDVTNNASRRPDQTSLTTTGPVAREEFWETMQSGAIIAEGVAPGETSHKPIRDAEWKTLSWQPEQTIPADALAGWWDVRPRYTQVFVRSADVIRKWPALRENENDANEARAEIQTGLQGRPSSRHLVEAEFERTKEVRLGRDDVLRLWEPQEKVSEIPTPIPNGSKRDAIPESKVRKLPPMQTRILEIAQELWPDRPLPVRVGDRDESIRKEFERRKETKPSPKSIARAFKADKIGQ